MCIHLVFDNTSFSPSSPHRERESDYDIYITNTLKELDSSVFLLNLQTVFLSHWRNFSRLVCLFHILSGAHWLSLLSCPPPTHTGVFRLWLTSQGRTLWGSTWWMHSNANITPRDATVVFFLSLSLFRLISAIFSVSLRLSLHACFSAALLFVEKQKRRKCLAFYFFLFSDGFYFHASHLPWSHCICLSSPLSSASLLSHVMDIMIVLPWLMIIL